MRKKDDRKRHAAFDAKRSNIFFLDPEEITIITDKNHPLYDPRVELPLKEPTIRSMMNRGVIQPVTIRKDGEQAIAVDGRRRVLHAREANRRLKADGATPIGVPVKQWRGDDVNAYEVAIELNEHREADSLLAKARKANVLLQRGRNEDQVGDVFGVSATTISAWTKLLDLHPRVQTAVEQGRISATVAVQKLGTLPRDEQAKALEELDASGGSGDVRKIVEKHGGRAGSKPLPGKKLLRRLVDVDREDESRNVFHKREIAILSFITGDISEGKVAEIVPGFIPLLRRAEKAKAARKEATG